MVQSPYSATFPTIDIVSKNGRSFHLTVEITATPVSSTPITRGTPLTQELHTLGRRDSRDWSARPNRSLQLPFGTSEKPRHNLGGRPVRWGTKFPGCSKRGESLDRRPSGTSATRRHSLRECPNPGSWSAPAQLRPLSVVKTKKSGQEELFLAGECHTITTDQLGKLNVSKRSVIAGPLSGTYGLLGAVIGFGKLSRLR